MKIEAYTNIYKKEWDDFVSTSKNGTFLFYRDFMEYHSDRFDDHSFLFYKKHKLIALLPGNIKNNIFYSHQGLSYGGLILSQSITTDEVLAVFEYFTTTLRQQGIAEIIYKAIPHIYHTTPSEEDLYALFINNAQIIGRGIASVFLLNTEKKYSIERKRGIKRGATNNLYVKKINNLESFWKILEENLLKRYNAKPVHSVEEITLLHDKFPKNILIYAVYNKEEEMVAGTVLFVSSNVIHLQYIASSNQGKKTGAIDFLIDYIISQDWGIRKYFDYGISTENNGLYLNQGLIHHKEGFGMRAIIYDIYSIKLT